MEVDFNRWKIEEKILLGSCSHDFAHTTLHLDPINTGVIRSSKVGASANVIQLLVGPEVTVSDMSVEAD
jgi:hypothetical protein